MFYLSRNVSSRVVEEWKLEDAGGELVVVRTKRMVRDGGVGVTGVEMRVKMAEMVVE